MATIASGGKVETYLGAKAEYLLGFKSPKIAKERLHLPGPDFVDRIFVPSDRNLRVLANIERLFNHGRLAGTGYLSILPVDQGIEAVRTAGKDAFKRCGKLHLPLGRLVGPRLMRIKIGKLITHGFVLRLACHSRFSRSRTGTKS